MKKERREFTRIPIPWDQSATFLRAGLQQFTVHLVNALPQGYAVTCPRRLQVSRGDLLRLRTSEGWVEVRVAGMDPVSDETYPEEYDCILGLSRVRNLGYELDDNWIVAVGVRRASLLLAALVLTGALVGSVLLPQSQASWRRLQAAISAVAMGKW
jgi:hypothetical protein